VRSSVRFWVHANRIWTNPKSLYTTHKPAVKVGPPVMITTSLFVDCEHGLILVLISVVLIVLFCQEARAMLKNIWRFKWTLHWIDGHKLNCSAKWWNLFLINSCVLVRNLKSWAIYIQMSNARDRDRQSLHLHSILSKAQHRSLNFLRCVIPVHKLLKCVIRVLKLYSSLQSAC
jgi:hypothetical protein